MNRKALNLDPIGGETGLPCKRKYTTELISSSGCAPSSCRSRDPRYVLSQYNASNEVCSPQMLRVIPEQQKPLFMNACQLVAYMALTKA